MTVKIQFELDETPASIEYAKGGELTVCDELKSLIIDKRDEIANEPRQTEVVLSLHGLISWKTAECTPHYAELVIGDDDSLTLRYNIWDDGDESGTVTLLTVEQLRETSSHLIVLE